MGVSSVIQVVEKQASDLTTCFAAQHVVHCTPCTGAEYATELSELCERSHWNDVILPLFAS